MAGYRKLGRTSNQRKAMIRSQVTALLYHGHIKTTETRSTDLVPFFFPAAWVGTSVTP